MALMWVDQVICLLMYLKRNSETTALSNKVIISFNGISIIALYKDFVSKTHAHPYTRIPVI